MEVDWYPTLLYNLPFFGRIVRLLGGAMLESWALKNPMLFIFIVPRYYYYCCCYDYYYDDDDDYFYDK